MLDWGYVATMSAHLIALIEKPEDGPHWADTEYGPTFWRLLEKYGGETIAAAALEQVEGMPLAESNAAIFRFPDMAAARGFWNDPDYHAVVPLRRRLGTFQIFLVPGVEETDLTPPKRQP
jgi:uncharacterized protein (DUF1330 family)